MINFAEIAKIAVDASKDDWRVSAALLAGTTAMGALGWWWNRRMKRKAKHK